MSDAADELFAAAYDLGKREVLEEVRKLTRTNNGYIPNKGWAYELVRDYVKKELREING